MGHAVDKQLLNLAQQSLKLLHEEFAALQGTIEEQEQILDEQAQQGEEHQQRIDEMSAQQAEQATQIDVLAQKQNDLERRVLELLESFRIQLKQGTLCTTSFHTLFFLSRSLLRIIRENEQERIGPFSVS